MDRVTLSPTEVAARSRLALTFWPSAFAASNNTKMNARILLISPILSYTTIARLAFLGGAINTLLLLDGVEKLANLLRGHLTIRFCLSGVGLLFAGLGLRLFFFVLPARAVFFLLFLFFLFLLLS